MDSIQCQKELRLAIASRLSRSILELCLTDTLSS
ncbi:hypothetical protein EAJG_04361 [Escherichia coli E267]|uniref:Uncharacterized protein n=1 Tax=Escherichia coli TA447 TaxID=656447 RepID=A0A1X3IXZ3_ECOLX|nr:hypothetical protein EAJG_04361 [Escherichia coli E267]OSK93061.1 hypothetical protein ECXG_04793 [Escherichia coli TA447]